ncbi:hypothetical protein HMPREF2758_06215 [Facklamia sp. HMSC062C11]|uniref:hypothetical protein n=1 Tax=Facklamia sp. HMSC062C11 TaxID=1739262 RepID=UPI0008A58AC8|nr:hypothetical protein [Facklamia sp. HMSC062C11]OFL67324.1 hypothetical protein HMPREF2758_06215 [Facklamia sp. HMSC062C11]
MKQEKIETNILNGLGYIECLEKKNGNNLKKQKTCKINSYRRLITVIGIKMGIFVKKNKLNNSSKWFTFGQKIRP